MLETIGVGVLGVVAMGLFCLGCYFLGRVETRRDKLLKGILEEIKKDGEE